MNTLVWNGTRENWAGARRRAVKYLGSPSRPQSLCYSQKNVISANCRQLSTVTLHRSDCISLNKTFSTMAPRKYHVQIHSNWSVLTARHVICTFEDHISQHNPYCYERNNIIISNTITIFIITVIITINVKHQIQLWSLEPSGIYRRVFSLE
jgi:hypothetical protein